MISWKSTSYHPKNGDILAFSGYTFQSYFINLMTFGVPRWGASHVGIVSKNLLFESTTTVDTPCVIQGIKWNGSQAHTIESRIPNYNGKVWVYRLKRSLKAEESNQLYKYLRATIGINYDMVGAFRSGGHGFSWLESKLRKDDQSALFCSEWCASALKVVNRFNTNYLGKWNPNSFLREGIRQDIFDKPVRLR